LQLLLQQSLPVVHVAPFTPQQRPVLAPGVSQCPTQQSPSALQWTVEAAAVLMQHLPFVQVSPEQQYAVVWSQAAPAWLHSHWPFVQRPLQHWAVLVHAAMAPPQQVPPRQVPL